MLVVQSSALEQFSPYFVMRTDFVCSPKPLMCANKVLLHQYWSDQAGTNHLRLGIIMFNRFHSAHGFSVEIINCTQSGSIYWNYFFSECILRKCFAFNLPFG